MVCEWMYGANILDLGIRWSASRPDHFNHRETAPGTHLIGGWMGPTARLNAVRKSLAQLIIYCVTD
jgi:hypothetical protein